jgi:hypothetical protein
MKKVSIVAAKQSRNIWQQKLTIGLDLGRSREMSRRATSDDPSRSRRFNRAGLRADHRRSGLVSLRKASGQLSATARGGALNH